MQHKDNKMYPPFTETYKAPDDSTSGHQDYKCYDDHIKYTPIWKDNKQ